MEKVKVTREQAEWLERYELTQEQIDYSIDVQPFRKRPDSPIVDWKPSKVARALYVGYEIEPEFKVGDHVKDFRGRVSEILEDNCASFVVGFIANGKMYKEELSKSSILKRATKEEAWWASHGRDVWELKKGDILYDESHGDALVVREVKTQNDMTAVFYMDDYMYLSDVKECYKVAIFAKNRLDVKTNE